jgi:predicted aldo/keto reductase-like oxidoreductase
MSEKKINRRDLFKLGAGAGALAFAGQGLLPHVARGQEAKPAADAPLPQVPRRKLGKTGKDIPILLVGGAVKLDPRFDPKLAEALRFGVNYFDAADCYGGGSCEPAVGSFMKQGNVQRDKLWITSKSDAHDVAGFESTLATTLQKLDTPYVDMYFLHALQDASFINNDLAKLVEQKKKDGKLRHFGFSCHDGNVAELLHKAAETSWVECVMFRYNFRQYGNAELNKAMDACAKANVGLIAMKTQGSEASFADKWQAFQKAGKWTKHQAVLKAVWADERISAAVSHMDTLEKLKENVAAALDKFDLGQADWDELNRYAAATRAYACDGCDHICNPAVDAPVQIGATMRYLMYHDVYGETDKAKALFGKLPAGARHLSGVDFAKANAACPYGVDVAQHMARAAEVFQA